MDPPPLDLEARPVRPGRIVSPLRVRGLSPAEGRAEQVFGKVAGRVVGTAHDATRPQLLAYLGMEREQFGGGQLGKVRQLFIHPFNELLPCGPAVSPLSAPCEGADVFGLKRTSAVRCDAAT